MTIRRNVLQAMKIGIGMGALICLIALAAACLPARADEVEIVSSDIEQLAKFIRLPATPKSARWWLTALGDPGLVGPTDYSLLALLEYDDGVCEAIVRGSESKAMAPLLSPQEVTDGLPLELRRRIEKENNGYYRVKGTAFAPGLFTKGSFLVGYVVRLDQTNLLLVALSTD